MEFETGGFTNILYFLGGEDVVTGAFLGLGWLSLNWLIIGVGVIVDEREEGLVEMGEDVLLELLVGHIFGAVVFDGLDELLGGFFVESHGWC